MQLEDTVIVNNKVDPKACSLEYGISQLPTFSLIQIRISLPVDTNNALLLLLIDCYRRSSSD